MRQLRALIFRLTSLLSKNRREQEMSAELESHLQMHIEDNLRRGLSAEEARRQALIKLGGVEQTKERVRAQRGAPGLESLGQDIGYGLRQLRRNPGFTAVAVLTLALGIGASTAIFSLINAVILRALPVADPEQLVMLKWSANHGPIVHLSYGYSGCPGPGGSEGNRNGCTFSYPVFEQIHNGQNVFSGVFGFAGHNGFDISFGGRVSHASSRFVSGDFFSALGVKPALGRLLEPTDDAGGAPPVVVLSYGFWQREFGGVRSVVGKTLSVKRTSFTIIGVAPAGFPGLESGMPVDFWMPMSQPSLAVYFLKMKTDPKAIWIEIGARLKPGVSRAQAESAVNVIFSRSTTSGADAIFKPSDHPRVELPSIARGLPTLSEELSKPLFLLFAAVGLILLIACANLAGLMLARSAARRKEIAVRLSLGAGRWRVARQLFTESAMLAAAGGVLGIPFAYWGASALVAFLSRNAAYSIPLKIDVRPDPHVLAFAIVVSTLTAILFGVAPSVLSTRVSLAPALKEIGGDYSGAAHRRGRRFGLGGLLVVAQVALTVVVLAGAGLLIRTLVNLEATKTAGFDTRNLLLFNIDTTLSGYKDAQLQNTYRDLQARFASLPGVTSASYSMTWLLGGAMMSTVVYVQGVPARRAFSPDVLPIGPQFLETLRIPLLSGRTLTPEDFDPKLKPQPVLINQTFAHEFLAGRNPLGLRLGQTPNKPDMEIVGVVGDAKYDALRAQISPTIYWPMTDGGASFELRTAADPRGIISLVRSAVAGVDKNFLVENVATQSEVIARALYQERLEAGLSGIFGIFAMLLAAIGLYGLLSYQVARRTHEMGIRFALGAQRRDVLKLVIGQGFALALAGVVIGTASALALTRLLSSLLYGVAQTDPFTYAAASAILVGVAVLASYLPARRAARVDPMTALRYE